VVALSEVTPDELVSGTLLEGLGGCSDVVQSPVLDKVNDSVQDLRWKGVKVIFVVLILS
jgi:hypothetical protein